MTWRVLAVVMALLFTEADCPLLAQQPSAPAIRVRRTPHAPLTAVLYDTPPTVADTPIDAMAKWIANGGKPLPPDTLQPAPTDEALLLPVELSCAAVGASSFAWYLGPTNPPPLVAANTPSCKMIATEGNPGQRIYWRVTARNAVGESSSPVRSFVVGGSTVEIIGADLTSGGVWVGTRGREGYWLAGNGSSLPPFAQIAVRNQFEYVWAASTPETRALQKPDKSGYFAATWYRDTTFDIDVNLTDGRIHQLSLYLLDWDKGNRRERIDVIDATLGQIVETQTTANDFSGGGYLEWAISGHVIFRVTNTGPLNAVVSGIFLDPPLTDLALTWDANPPAEQIARYEIGMGTTRGTYPTVTSVGLATYWDVTGVPEDGKPYWIAVRAQNATGASPWSAPIAVVFVPPKG